MAVIPPDKQPLIREARPFDRLRRKYRAQPRLPGRLVHDPVPEKEDAPENADEKNPAKSSPDAFSPDIENPHPVPAAIAFLARRHKQRETSRAQKRRHKAEGTYGFWDVRRFIAPQERLILSTRPSFTMFFAKAQRQMAAFGGALFLLLLPQILGGFIPLTVAGAAILMWASLTSIPPLLAWRTQAYVLTSHRLLRVSGTCKREFQEIAIEEIKNPGLTESLIGTGSISLECGIPELEHLTHVPHTSWFYYTLLTLQENPDIKEKLIQRPPPPEGRPLLKRGEQLYSHMSEAPEPGENS